MVPSDEQVLSCPKCGWSDVRSSEVSGFWDQALSLVLFSPLRCRKCRLRYYRPWFIARRTRPVAPVQTHRQAAAIATVPLPVPAVPQRILLLDDDPALRKLFSRLLGREGYEVHEASDTCSALEELGAGGMDLVFVNFSAHETGESAVQLLITAYPALKIIALSETAGLAEPSQKLRILPKPSRALAVVQSVREMISQERQAGNWTKTKLAPLA